MEILSVEFADNLLKAREGPEAVPHNAALVTRKKNVHRKSFALNFERE